MIIGDVSHSKLLNHVLMAELAAISKEYEDLNEKPEELNSPQEALSDWLSDGKEIKDLIVVDHLGCTEY
jgi:hypothetical protein